MAKFSKSVFIILFVSVFTCWYVTRFNLPKFFTGGPKQEKKQSIEARTAKAEQEIAVFMKILEMVKGSVETSSKSEHPPPKESGIPKMTSGVPPGLPAI